MKDRIIVYHLFYLFRLIDLVEDAVGENRVVLRGITVIAEVEVQKMWAIDADTVFSTHGLRTPLTNSCSEFIAIWNIASIH